MLMFTEHLSHLLCCPAQTFFFTQIGICQRLGKEPGAAAQDQVWLLRQVDGTTRQGKMPSVGLLIVCIELLDGFQQRVFCNAALQHRLIQGQLEPDGCARCDTFPAEVDAVGSAICGGVCFSGQHHAVVRD